MSQSPDPCVWHIQYFIINRSEIGIRVGGFFVCLFFNTNANTLRRELPSSPPSIFIEPSRPSSFLGEGQEKVAGPKEEVNLQISVSSDPNFRQESPSISLEKCRLGFR